jgi:hypothetical protein
MRLLSSISIIISAASLIGATSTAEAAAADPGMLAADRAFVQAVAHQDATSATKTLDAEFTWIAADGTTHEVSRVLEALPTPAIADETRAETKQYGYGQVGVVQVNAGKLHALRVWVKRPAGWRLLVFQEVRSLDAPATSTPGTGKTCENPCGAVPYNPKNATERDVMKAYSSLEEAATSGHATEWSAIAADEIALVSANSDRMFDKPTRAAAIARATLGGVAPTRLISARLFDFPDAVVMTSRHQPDRGDPLQITRVWIKRDGRWQETLSYQTTIHAGAARAPEARER